MEPEKITKEKAEEFMNIPGETRGISIKGDLEYIIHREGKEGLLKLEERASELGFPIKYEEFKEMDFYPVGLEAITFLLMEELFHFKRDDFIKMGEFNSKVSLIVRLFMKYFVSMETIAKEAPKFWGKYYTRGHLSVTEINKQERYIVVRIEDFELHPIHCLTVEGYLISIIKMVLNKDVVSEERKCMSRGDSYHEFVVNWKK